MEPQKTPLKNMVAARGRKAWKRVRLYMLAIPMRRAPWSTFLRLILSLRYPPARFPATLPTVLAETSRPYWDRLRPRSSVA